jgi:hypothetical protein
MRNTEGHLEKLVMVIREELSRQTIILLHFHHFDRESTKESGP